MSIQKEKSLPDDGFRLKSTGHFLRQHLTLFISKNDRKNLHLFKEGVA